MKKIVFIFIFLLLIIGQLFPCSSFSVYSNITMMGMNFDFFNDPEMKLDILHFDDTKAFTLSFEHGENFYQTLGISDSGLFQTFQSVAPKTYIGEYKITKNIGGLIYEVMGWEDLDEIDLLLEKYRLVSPSNFSLHTHIAHMDGRAMVLEVGKNGNVVIERKSEYLVMTNFFMGDYDVFQDGIARNSSCWRYENIRTMLDKYTDNLDLNKGFEILESAVQSLTMASVIFIPEEMNIYICFKKDFDKVWKISLEDETIETFKGFETPKISKIGGKGILESSLVEWK